MSWHHRQPRAMPPVSLLALVATVVVTTLAASGQRARGAELIGYAVLPADTFAQGPPSGAFNSAGERGTPRFPSQPVQGFSAVRPLGGGAFLVLSDNGFGSKKNSPDFLLRIYTIRPNLRTSQGGAGTIEVDRGFVQLRDPDRRVDFQIVNENTADRLLTGADFDPESLVVAMDGTFWVGDEFGPFLLHFDQTGRLLGRPISVPDPRADRNPAKDMVRSPDNPFLTPPVPGAAQTAILKRSKGLENLARSADGSSLYAMLEGPLAGDPDDRLLILDFDLGSDRFTSRSWAYQLSAAGYAVRDMVAVSDTEFLIVEGDGGHGPSARHKKIFLIDLRQKDAQGYVAKQEVADLLNIRDPRNVAGFGTMFTFPYETIEAIAVLDPTTIVVLNDNNYPAGGARPGVVRDPNEFLVLRLDRTLNFDPRLAAR